MPLIAQTVNPPRAAVAGEPSVRLAHTAGPLGARLGLGGAGWRAGVPHMIIYAGDTTGAAAFPVTQDLGYYATDGQYLFPPDIDESWWPPGTWVQPASSRATGPVHINAFKAHQQEHLPISWTWNAATRTWDPLGIPGGSSSYGFERFGHTGDWWLGDPEHPEVIATVPQALSALADLDINVMCLQGSATERFVGTTSYEDIGFFNMTLDELNAVATTPALAPALDGVIWHVSDIGRLFPFAMIGIEGSAVAHLTGAVDDNGRSIGWALTRFLPDNSEFEPLEDLAERVTTDLVAHAARLGNSDSFDVAFLIDDTGSFGSSRGRATTAFLTIIDALLAQNKDIYVGISRYSDYGARTHWNGNGEERPFILQYPLAPVASDDERAALIEALQTNPYGDGGGDTPETQWEGLYQLASGAGLDANHNGSTTDSGVAGVPGPILLDLHTILSDAEFDAFIDPAASNGGLGWYRPGFSGDVPAFASTSISRLTVIPGPRDVRVTSEGKDF